MRRLHLLAAAALVALAFVPAPADALFSPGCPTYDIQFATSAGTLHLATGDPLHTGAWLLEAREYYLTHDGVSQNAEVWTSFWTQLWQETNGVPGLQRGTEVCDNCHEESTSVECDAWLTGP